jgi:GNAT superfamily N-acetyltransferase
MSDPAPTSELNIRIARKEDRDPILDFIRAVGFNPRDAVTWDGLHMTAITAWASAQLIGAIPLEPRPLQVAPRRVVTTLHQTAVAVHPDYRGRGVGSRLQAALQAEPPVPAELATVFREEPKSAAYRWYVQSGFTAVMHIDSWFLSDPKADDALLPPPGYEEREPILDASGSLDALWRKAHGGRFAGVVDRTRRPLAPWLAVHPYRSRYQFQLVTLPNKAGDLAGYALLGVGRLHSETIRADLLELIADSPSSRADTVRAVLDAAAANGWQPVRWPIAASDGESVELAAQLGFEKRWGFDLLAKPLNGFSLDGLDFSQWRYASVDYI